ncbi:helix-turn-helix transcriptional regulator [Pedobacter insulae]|uniref:HTH domain-containing protein n=1 Tax=Pedobacter insulae TaxID=414048 RepID=A0A1I2SZR4_9SPHI|nr:YafY family protein [Pedobacter insulae]SFG55441.1 HTH domain-containing protein [Pedobacter insulae]
MEHNDTKRLSRLTAILTQLQTKKLITAAELAKKHNVSIRTIYRDIRALEQGGIPIFTDEGKGYSLLDGYRMPPISFTESEANALVTAEQLVIKNKDASFVREYVGAISKIKSVLRKSTQEKANMLAARMEFRPLLETTQTSNYLSALQLALTSYKLVKLTYNSLDTNETTQRIIEPFALYNTQENWLLIAICRLRKEHRTFRLDRIESLEILDETFVPHKMTLPEYFEICRAKSFANP